MTRTYVLIAGILPALEHMFYIGHRTGSTDCNADVMFASVGCYADVMSALGD